MTLPVDRPVRRWEDAGARVAPSLATLGAVLVTGDDPIAAARAAIGIGRVEALRRRVAIGDLVGDVPPLVALVDADDPHGIVDSFLYGVSLNKVAHPVRGTDNLFVLPTGTEPDIDASVFVSDRWRRLASGFREVGALLLLVAPADAPGLDRLAEALDGVVAVGEDAALRRRFEVLATVDATPPEPVAAVPAPLASEPAATLPADAVTADVVAAGVMPAEIVPAEAVAEPVSAPAQRRRPHRPPRITPSPAPGVEDTHARHGWRIAVGLLVLALGVVGAGLWILRDRADTAEVARTAAQRAVLDSLRRVRAALAAPAPAPADTLPVLVPINPADSARAAAWAIEIRKHNTEEGARMGHAQATALPLASWFPVLLGNDRGVWYRVVGGAWDTRAAADSALAALRGSGGVDASAAVMRAPYALIVGAGIAPDSARALTGRFVRDSVVPAEALYALRQDDGTVNVYVGAFETPDQSMLLAQALQAGGTVPTLVYRTGRAF